MRLSSFIIPAVLSVGLLDSALAAQYCVGTPDQLRNAMQQAQSSAVADEIRLKTGIYGAPSVPGTDAQYDVTLGDGNNLTLSGGWTDANCSVQHQIAGETLLDGFDARRIFDFGVADTSGGASVLIQNLSMRRGFSSGIGGCLRFQGYQQTGAALTLERVRISECTSGARGGAIAAIAQSGQIRILGSLMLLNSGLNEGAAYLNVVSGVVVLTNNTIVENLATDAASGVGGITVGCKAPWACAVSNNVFYLNKRGQIPADLALLNLTTSIYHNRLDARSGVALQDVATTQALPQFVSANDFRLKPSSPLRNAGMNNPSGGLTALDLDGGTRVQGGAPDIGALEYSELFANGFE